ncbi:MAG: sporulation protein YtxC [Bacillota bacterium]
MELVFCVDRSLKRDFAWVLREELRVLRREGLRCRLAVTGGIFRIRAPVKSDNEKRYVRLRLSQAAGTFLARHALEIRAEDFLRRKELWEAKVAETVKKRLYVVRELLLPLRSEIIVRLNEYLTAENWVDFRGFLRFRLKHIEAFLTVVFWRLVDEVQFELEWEHFISFLRRFRQGRNPGVKQVHCFPGEEGGFTLLDKRGHLLELVPPAAAAGDEPGNEDVLIGSLLVKGVQKITLHRWTPSPPALKVLRAVFHVKECSGCSLCRPKVSAEKGAARGGSGRE